MHKVSHRHWLILTLPGLFWLLAALVINGGVGALMGWGLPVASAAEPQPATAPQEECTAEQHRPFFGSAVVVNSGEVICSNLTSFGGDVVIRGVVRGDVVSFGGNVLIEGTVEGAIRAYGGNVILHNGAEVGGDIHLCGGQRNQDSASHLNGSIYDCPKSIELLLAGDGEPGFRFWSIVIWVALGLLLTTLLPEHVMLVRTTAKIKTSRSLVIGLLSVLLAPAILAVLVALIIPIPLAILVTIGLIAAWALGTVAIGWLIGEYIVSRVAPQQNTRPIQVIVGLTCLALLSSLPYIGLFISIGIGLLGLGAVFLSRFGTRLYTQPRQPLSL